MNHSLEDKILLQFGDERRHLQTSEIDAERTDKEIALSNLVRDGYVTARENGNSKYDKYISLSITTEGKARQKELKRLLGRSCWEQCRDAVKNAWRSSRPSVRRIAEGIIIAVMSGLICFGIGRATAPHEPDKSADNGKQEQTDNSTFTLD